MASYEELEKQIIELRRLGKWTQALPLARECCDRFHIYGRDVNLEQIVQKVLKIDETFIGTLKRREPDSASKNFFLGFVLWAIKGYSEEHRCAAFKRFTLAAESGHALAAYFKAESGPSCATLEITQTNVACWYKAAARMGCPTAMLEAHAFEDNPVDVALWYARAVKLREPGADYALVTCVSKHPVDSVPFGRWQPDPCYQLLLRPMMRKALFTWLLVAKRLVVPRDIAGYICHFIITRPYKLC